MMSARAIVERDVEVLRRDQLANRLVNRPEEVLKARRRVHGEGDAVGGVACRLAAMAAGDVAEAPDPPGRHAVRQRGPRGPLQNPAILEVQEVLADRFGLRIELPNLGEKGLGVRKLVEHVGEGPVVVPGAEDLLRQLPELGEAPVEAHDPAGAVDHQEALFGRVEHRLQEGELLGERRQAALVRRSAIFGLADHARSPCSGPRTEAVRVGLLSCRAACFDATTGGGGILPARASETSGEAAASDSQGARSRAPSRRPGEDRRHCGGVLALAWNPDPTRRRSGAPGGRPRRARCRGRSAVGRRLGPPLRRRHRWRTVVSSTAATASWWTASCRQSARAEAAHRRAAARHRLGAGPGLAPLPPRHRPR